MPKNDGANVNVSALYPDVQRRMVEHGDWQRLSAVLMDKLNERGWLDDIRHQSKAEILRSSDGVSVEGVISQLWTQAEGSVPANVKREMLSAIRQYLEGELEG